MKEEEGPGLPISVRHLTQHSRSMACHNNRPLTVSFIVWAAVHFAQYPAESIEIKTKAEYNRNLPNWLHKGVQYR